MKRQTDIDKICKWLGWQINPDSDGTYWKRADGVNVNHELFDPFNFIQDCEMVMIEIAKRAETEDITFIYKWSSPDKVHKSWMRMGNKMRMASSQESEPDARMNAVLEMVKE
jgi:hypothetical protein